MNIEFSITSIPRDDQYDYFLAYLEGELEILLNDKLFLKVTDILLAELGVSLIRWLAKIKKGEIIEFCYETMDSEETPILEISINEDMRCSLYSIWQEYSAKNSYEIDFIITVTEDFVRRLSIELEERCNVLLTQFE